MGQKETKKQTLFENKSGKIKEKTKKTNLYNQVENMKRKEEQKQDFFLGLFSSRASRKKMYKKNRKIVKNLLMYDKKNFLPLHTKKLSPRKKKKKKKKKNPPKKKKKKKKKKS